jgi:hypothetical protein
VGNRPVDVPGSTVCGVRGMHRAEKNLPGRSGARVSEISSPTLAVVQVDLPFLDLPMPRVRRLPRLARLLLVTRVDLAIFVRSVDRAV